MNEMPGPLPIVNCCDIDLATLGMCSCSVSEKVLRAFADGRAKVKMTAAQREWALAEIGLVEGYSQADFFGLDDRDLSSAVIQAWTDYLRDKGLL